MAGVKPISFPESDARDWQSWPKLETLHAESGLTVAQLRKLLAQVPCYRCKDNSVRYEPEPARDAVFGFEEEDEPTETEEVDGLGDKGDVYQLLCRELLRALREERKDRSELVRSMTIPLERGMQLIDKTISTQATRLEHLEDLWDRMVKTSEEMLSAHGERERADNQAKHSQQMKQQTFNLVKEQLPTLLNKWALTAEATMALEFLASLDPKIVDAVIATGVLDQAQEAMLKKLRDALDARKRAAADTVPPANETEPINTEGTAA